MAHDRLDPSESRAATTCRSLCAGRRGRPPYGTADGGLNRTVPGRPDEPLRFERLAATNPADARSPPSDNVENVLVDRGGALWAGTWDAGLQRYDAARNAFVRRTNVPRVRSDERIQDFLEYAPRAALGGRLGIGPHVGSTRRPAEPHGTRPNPATLQA